MRLGEMKKYLNGVAHKWAIPFSQFPGHPETFGCQPRISDFNLTAHCLGTPLLERWPDGEQGRPMANRLHSDFLSGPSSLLP